jgi:hypothetical protein
MKKKTLKKKKTNKRIIISVVIPFESPKLRPLPQILESQTNK